MHVRINEILYVLVYKMIEQVSLEGLWTVIGGPPCTSGMIKFNPWLITRLMEQDIMGYIRVGIRNLQARELPWEIPADRVLFTPL